jgi:hypothetical protein
MTHPTDTIAKGYDTSPGPDKWHAHATCGSNGTPSWSPIELTLA